ncbi:protein disulfide-isomerase tmx3 [Anaeramoeba flamelloides]|uniref:Protein disulfide-isomerase tmx3 n=1 Tax=Anaeramoeba flamelloides TaxID=1746091 RepID=A0AAV8A1U9_9EUKA|nr:protein disulfide-isomerase tmx3 [Anaeramoeba flamelloides]
MNKLLLFILFLFFFKAIVSAVEVTDNYYELDEESFEKIPTSNERWFVKFYTNWCGDCKKLAPKFDQVAKAFPDLKFGGVNCDKKRSVCGSQNILDFPTLKFYYQSNVWDFELARTYKQMYDFCDKFSQPSILPITTTQLNNTTGLLTNSMTNFVIVHDPLKNLSNPDCGTLQLIQRSEDSRNDLRFWSIASADLPTNNDLFSSVIQNEENNGRLLLAIRDDEIKPKVFNLCDNYETEQQFENELQSFINNNSIPLIPQFNLHTYRRISESKALILIAFINPAIVSNKNYLSLIKQVALKEKRIGYTWLDGTKWEKYIAKYEITIDDLPNSIITNIAKEYYYEPPFEDGFQNEQQIQSFIDDIFLLKIPPKGAGSGVGGLFQQTTKEIMAVIKEKPLITTLFFTLLIVISSFLMFCMRH